MHGTKGLPGSVAGACRIWACTVVGANMMLRVNKGTESWASERKPFVSPGQLALRASIVSQFEKDGGLFAFPIRQHSMSGRLDPRCTLVTHAF
jgi:hypothetical protein